VADDWAQVDGTEPSDIPIMPTTNTEIARTSQLAPVLFFPLTARFLILIVILILNAHLSSFD
jgi:hypothetical protein